MAHNGLEEGTSLVLDFNKVMSVAAIGNKVIPATVQDIKSKEVLLIAYVNRQALSESLQSGYAVFWSTSRNTLWRKGASSGDRLKLHEVRVNCEQNALLFLVEPVQKGVCHTKTNDGRTRSTCFYRRIDGTNLNFLGDNR